MESYPRETGGNRKPVGLGGWSAYADIHKPVGTGPNFGDRVPAFGSPPELRLPEVGSEELPATHEEAQDIVQQALGAATNPSVVEVDPKYL